MTCERAWIPLPSSRRLDGLRACEPWPPKLAEKQFLQKPQALQAIAARPRYHGVQPAAALPSHAGLA